jgi:hypothetical protein
MEATLESDAFAIAMLVVIFCALGVVALLLLTMRWRAARRDQHVDALLEELEQEQKQAVPHAAEATPPAPWEKDADWWKQG